MDLSVMLNDKLVQFDFEVRDKEEAIKKIGGLMYESGKVTDKQKYIDGLFQRETECTTGIGMGVAIPHCKSTAVKEAGFALVKLKAPIEWGTLDGGPVNYIIMLAAPDSSENTHLKMLSQLAKNLMDDDFRETLTHAKSIEEIQTLFKKGE